MHARSVGCMIEIAIELKWLLRSAFVRQFIGRFDVGNPTISCSIHAVNNWTMLFGLQHTTSKHFSIYCGFVGNLVLFELLIKRAAKTYIDWKHENEKFNIEYGKIENGTTPHYNGTVKHRDETSISFFLGFILV